MRIGERQVRKKKGYFRLRYKKLSRREGEGRERTRMGRGEYGDEVGAPWNLFQSEEKVSREHSYLTFSFLLLDVVIVLVIVVISGISLFLENVSSVQE